MANLRLSDAETVKFIEYYRNEPVLWDPTNERYKKRESRAAAAQRIAEALNLPDFTAIQVITKFKNLRSSYAQEIKKIGASTKSGVSTEDIYVPKVVWFKQMDAFLRPHVKSRATQSNLSILSQESRGINIDDDEAENAQSEFDFQDVDAVTDPSSQPEPSTEQPSTSTQQTKHFTQLQTPNSTRTVSEAKSKSSSFRNPETPIKRPSATRERIVEKKQHVENERPEILMCAMDKLDKISERATANKEDQFDIFGKYLASLLRTLPINQACMLQQQMITRALNAQVSNSISTPSPSTSNDQTQAGEDHAFSPQSQDTWASELSAAMNIYT